MKCHNCNSEVNLFDNYCFKCGTLLKCIKEEKPQKNYLLLMGISFSFCSLFIIGLFAFISYSTSNNPTIYFNDTLFATTKNSNSNLYNFYTTTINYDTKYNFVNIANKKDAIDLIQKESQIQKEKCGNDLVIEEEKKMMDKYNITAINLCEMSMSDIKSIDNTLNQIFKMFPSAKGYMTNLTLMNPNSEDNFIASFEPISKFANANLNISLFPLVIKSSMLLNSNYYLDNDNFQEVVRSSEAAGWFVKNANKDSIIVHEMGHYLSFVALLKKYNIESLIYIKKEDLSKLMELNKELETENFSKDLVNTAYNNYIKNNEFISLLEFQSAISQYSASGVYDETIAEAFHDYYLNGNNATKESLAIIKVLKEWLN